MHYFYDSKARCDSQKRIAAHILHPKIHVFKEKKQNLFGDGHLVKFYRRGPQRTLSLSSIACHLCKSHSTSSLLEIFTCDGKSFSPHPTPPQESFHRVLRHHPHLTSSCSIERTSLRYTTATTTGSGGRSI